MASRAENHCLNATMELVHNASNLAAAAALGLLTYLLVSSVLAHRRLRHFPGPFLASFSYLYMLRVWISRRQSASHKNLNKIYKSGFVRIGPNDLITDDPEFVKKMNSARSKYGRSSWYAPTKLNPYDDSLVNMLDVKEHDRLKAKMSFGYGGKENPELETGMNEDLQALVDLIRRKYISVGSVLKPFDIATAAQFFTLDAITRMAYGKAFGYLTNEEDVFGYMKATETGTLGPGLVNQQDHSLLMTFMSVVPFVSVCGEIPWIGDVLYSKPVLKFMGPKKTDKSGVGKLLA